jgi:hypothetical protein
MVIRKSFLLRLAPSSQQQVQPDGGVFIWAKGIREQDELRQLALNQLAEYETGFLSGVNLEAVSTLQIHHRLPTKAQLGWDTFSVITT